MRPPEQPAQGALVDALRRRIEAVLEPLLDGVERVAFVNFPNHGNVGDPALWLGTHRVLRRLGVRVGYQCEHRTYEPSALAATRPEAILINGGGNFGDLWRGQQQARERVLADFPRLPTIQLPQSVSFTHPRNLARMQRLIAAHHDLILLLRDPVSRAKAAEWFDAPTDLCPDMAFGLGVLPRAAPASRDVLWLARQDKESAIATPEPGDLEAQVLDWLERVPDEPPWPRRARLSLDLNQRLTPRVRRDAAAARRWSRPLAATYRPLAEARLRRGLLILSRGRVVITDRLHGHVLSLLQGIPHVALDSAGGKVRALHDEFTHASPLVHWAETPDEAVAIARGLLEHA